MQILQISDQAECTTLYSEDMQYGQIIDNRMMVINPFL